MSKRNENRPEYKKTKLGWIPKEWEICNFENNLDILSGYGFKFSEYAAFGVRLLRIDNVSHGKITWDSVAYLPEDYIQKCSNLLINNNDILLALNRPITQNQLKIARLPKEFAPCILYQRVGKIVFKTKKYHPDYVYYLLSINIKRFVEKTSIGSDQPFIKITQLKKQLLVLPPYQEQQKIAEVLSAWDSAIEQTKKLIEAKQKLKKGLMQQLLTGRMRFPAFGQPVENKGELPERWRDDKLGNIVKISIGKTPLRKIKPYWDSAKITNNKWATISDLRDTVITDTKEYVTNEAVKKCNLRIIKKGTLLMSFKLTIGKMAWAGCDMYTNEAIASLIPLSYDISSEYLFYIVPLMIDFADTGQAIKGKTLNQASMRTMRILCIEKNEQNKIVSVLKKHDKQIEDLCAKKDFLQKQKKGLMQKLLTGEIRVKNAKKLIGGKL